MNGYKILVSAACGIMLAGAIPARADISDIESADTIATEAKVSLGYRATSVHGAPGRAQEFDSLESGPLFKAKLFTDQGPYHIDLGLDYLNDDDFSAEAHVDAMGLLRVDLRSARLFHNLDHIPYANGNSGDPAGIPSTRAAGVVVEGSRPDALFRGGYRAFYSDQNPGDKYGRRIDTNEVRLKVKCPDYPAHINLSYWRYEKEGDKQLRFAGENCTTACHMQSKTRKIDRVTEEIKASVDAHVGLVDVVFETLFRTFRDREPIPTDDFGTHSRTGTKTFLDYQHDEDPDSKLKEYSIKLNTAPSGGFVASAAFTLGERESQSDLNAVAPVEAKTDYYRASADITYTPKQDWTLNFRYRLLDMDSDNTDYFRNYYVTALAGSYDMRVREAMDIKRAWYEGIVNYRPHKQLSLKAELRREEIDRSNTGEPTTVQNSGNRTITDTWELPDEEIITRLKLGFSSRLLDQSALKLSGWVAIQQNDDPAYGTSFGQSQELYLATSYTPSPFWGLTANVNLLKQENDDYELYDFDIDREKQQQNLTLGTWLNPREGLSFDLNYGYFRTTVNQDLLFGTSTHEYTSGPAEVVDYRIFDSNDEYRQTVQSVTAGMTWQALKNLACRLEGHHIRSKADFSPDFNAVNVRYRSGLGDATSADLRDISKLDIIQNGVRGRVDWQLNENLTCGVEATFDDYDERGNDLFDGSVQSYMASLSYMF